MNKNIKIIMRMIFLIFLIVLIFGGINLVLKIKYDIKDKLAGWTWENENTVIERMLFEKYTGYDTEYFPLVDLKNKTIPQKDIFEKRILVVGDSYVWGTSNTNINYTWWKQLDLEIKKAGYSNVNVYAAAFPGYSTEDQLNKILENNFLIDSIDPDLIIMGYVGNDPEWRNSNGEKYIKEEWEINKEDIPLYKDNKNLYYELLNYIQTLSYTEEDKLREIGDKLGFYREDLRRLMMTEGDHLEHYEQVLKTADSRLNELGIPYFFLNTDYYDTGIAGKALNNAFELMDKLSINVYDGLKSSKALKKIEKTWLEDLWINPGDSHPGITWTSSCGKYAFDVLKRDYNFIFENSIYQDINKLELNINDTMPYLGLDKLERNIYEFEYPIIEKTKTNDSNFLFYPIEKNYVKLNLQYPKKISKIIISGDNLEGTEIYVNTINPKYGYDYDEEYNKVTSCKEVDDNNYIVNKTITSVNIVANFKSEDDRRIKIEFIEEE